MRYYDLFPPGTLCISRFLVHTDTIFHLMSSANRIHAQLRREAKQKIRINSTLEISGNSTVTDHSTDAVR
jgi:hypothetical protein